MNLKDTVDMTEESISSFRDRSTEITQKRNNRGQRQKYMFKGLQGKKNLNQNSTSITNTLQSGRESIVLS